MSTPIVATEGPDDGAGPVGAGPGESSGDPGVRRRHRRWWIVVAIVAVLGAGTAAAFLVELPYYLVQPGAVRPAEQRVEVSGAESFEPGGEILFTTVYMSRATPGADGPQPGSTMR